MTDLISREDAIDTFMDEVTSYGLMDDEGNIESGCKDKDVIAMLENLQSVDAEPVRHGRWIRDEFGTRCGACGLYAYRDKFDQPWESPYCPYCGAKMDGDEHETD